ncbi:MAG: hypothetical protein L3J81_05640, partial [Thermoplasmata archaeon]|nr:hypothetical protein [Thermoplasmata archaeon]
SESFGAAWQYFTGSKDHNIATRSLARDRGLKINEYAVMRGEERLPSATEAEIYRSLDLPWIPPEIREAQGEIEAAQAGTLPRLLESSDLLGELHLHVAPGDGPERWEAQLASPVTAKLQYVGFVASELAQLSALRSWVRERTVGRVAILVGWESTPSSVDSPPAGEVDFRVLRPEGPPPKPEARRVGTGPVWVGHLGIDPEDSNGAQRLSDWVAWGLRHSVALEVTPAPFSEGLDAVAARKFAEAGGHLIVSEATLGPDRSLGLAVGTARRGWIGPGPVLNARPWRTGSGDWPPPK